MFSLLFLLFPLLSAHEDVTIPVKVCDNIFTTDSKELLLIPGFEGYFCKNDTLIYTPGYDNLYPELKIEFSMVKCNAKTVGWEAVETYQNQHEYKVIKKEKQLGKLECKTGKKLSCEVTRFDFDDQSIVDSDNFDDPIYKEKTYTCVKPEHHLYLKKKFTYGVQSGHYITAPKIICDNDELRAHFSHVKTPQLVDYRDTITCKKFECGDTLDHSLSYFNVLKMDTLCPSGEADDCIKPDFYNEQFPCGEEGHELTIRSEEDELDKYHFVKDNYIACGKDNELSFTDVWGEIHIVKEKDQVLCRRPRSCPTLMTAPNRNYGCNGRYDCYDIHNSTIPTYHLSKFTGNCLGGHVLKVMQWDGQPFLIELSYIECRNGKWIAHLLEESIANGEVVKLNEDLPLIGEGRHTIETTANLVCKRRVDFLRCDDPPSDCFVDKTTKLDGSVCTTVKSKDGRNLSCENAGMRVVEYLKYNNGSVVVREFPSDPVCDRGSGQWTTKSFPFQGLSADEEKTSYVVCAKETCNPASLPKSDCGKRVSCLPIDVLSKYWTRVICPPFYEMKYQADTVSTKNSVLNYYFCDKDKWSVHRNDTGKATEVSDKDNIFCQEIGVLDIMEDFQEGDGNKYKNKERSPDSSAGCLPTKLDSICPVEMRYHCVPVIKEAAEWKCPTDKKMLYIEYGKNTQTKRYVESLKCTKPFWKTIKDKVELIPSPHANFVCVSRDDNVPDDTEDEVPLLSRIETTKETKQCKFRWPIPAVESVVLTLSIAIFIASASIIIYGNREWYKTHKGKLGERRMS